MSDTVTNDLRFIVGVFFGVINRHSKDLKLWSEEKEDSVRTLQYYKKDGVVVRYNYIGVKTRFYAEGGMSANADRIKASKTAVLKTNKKTWAL